MPTTTWTPRSSDCSWRKIGCPPYTGTTLTPSSRPYLKIASDTCIASSRVGTSTSAEAVGRPRPIVQRVEQRQGERRRLAGAGRRLADEVAALDQVGDRLALHRRRLLVAELGQRVEQLAAQPEGGKAVTFVEL